jgi:hypothetical protein
MRSLNGRLNSSGTFLSATIFPSVSSSVSSTPLNFLNSDGLVMNGENIFIESPPQQLQVVVDGTLSRV